MARHLGLLPWRQLLVDLAQRVRRPLLQPRDLFGDVDRLAAIVQLLEFEDLAFEVGNGLFEIEVVVHSLAEFGASTGRPRLI